MNKAIIAGIIGLAVGATGGYCLCHFTEKSKIDKAISDGIQKELDYIRGSQKQKALDNEQKKSEMIKTTGRNINPIPHMSATSLVKDICRDEGYIKEDDVKEPDNAPDDDLPFEIANRDGELLKKAEAPEEKKQNIWDMPEEKVESVEDYEDRQEPDQGVDMAKLDPTKPPYEITDKQFSEELQTETEQGFWDKSTLVFFKDNVFAEKTALNDFQTMSAAEIDIAIGKNNIKKFIEDRSLGRIFIRNNKLHIDYEIVRSPRSYTSAINIDDDEE